MDYADVSHAQIPAWASLELRDEWSTCDRAYRELLYRAKMHPSGIARVTLVELAGRIGRTPRMVQKAITRLVELGMVHRRYDRCYPGRAQEYVPAWERPFGPPRAPEKPAEDFQGALPMAAPASSRMDEMDVMGDARMDVIDPVDKSEWTSWVTPITGEMDVMGDAPYRSTNRSTPPPVLPSSLTTAREDVESNDGGLENQTNDNDPVAVELAESVERISERVAARIGRGGVWPRHPRFRGRLRVWMEAGWTRDHLVELFVSKTELELVNDPGAVVASILSGEPPTAPYAPDHYRPAAFHAKREADRRAAEQRKAAENGTEVAPVPTGSRRTPVDATEAMVASLIWGNPSEDVLDVVEGRTDELAATGSEG